ncbi:MAG: ABC transporter permease [Bacilli bacterium]|nr:ABC transporter permease [Bacilli bacterium]
MFLHNFIYALKILCKNKVLIFWTFAFPIILGTLFNLAFSNISNSEKLDVIDIAVAGENINSNFKESIDILSNKDNSDKLFNTKYVTLNEAKKLLDDEKIVGYIYNEKIVVKKSGIEQTIFKYVVDEINSKINMSSSIFQAEISKEIENGNYNINYELINKKVNDQLNTKVSLNDTSNKNLDYVMIEFYTLIAMACLYGSLLSMTCLNNIMPNMSNEGKRLSISKTKKVSLILSNLCASYLVQLVGLLILFTYTIFALHVNYGSNLIYIILLSLAGSLAGLSLGVVVSIKFKVGENAKIGILIGIVMFWCFLSGMMGITMKYIVDKNIPILNKINPANMITDGFYSLYYYDTLDRYLLNVISLIVFSLLLLVISILNLRRQKYDSI